MHNNDIKLTISIMHCSSNNIRRTMLKSIINKIDESLIHSLKIADDPNKNGIWWNYKQALKLRPDDSTHHLVLQDDMLPCDNFIPLVLNIISKMKEEVIHIFASSYHYKYMLDNNYNIFKASGGVWGGSVILPKQHFEWYNWVEKYFNNNIIGKHLDDERMFLYFYFNKINMYCITPGLLQHIGDKSLIGSVSGRKAFTYLNDKTFNTNNINIKNAPDVGFIWGPSIKEMRRSLNSKYKEEFIKQYCNGSIKNFIKMVKSSNVQII